VDKITVIVPVYGVEVYLRQCLDSIVSQTYTNLEIILINDGSPDNCGIICDEYAEKDDRIKVMHKENGGVSKARNTGIDIASGEYLTFIDADDWVETDMIEVLYNNLVRVDADISSCGMYHVYVNAIVPFSDIADIEVLDSEQAINDSLTQGRVNTAVWGKLYKPHIFNDIRYPVGKRYEDEFVIFNVLAAANSIVVDTSSKYYYRQRKGSFMDSVHHTAEYNAGGLDLIEAAEQKMKVVEEKYPELIGITKAHLFDLNSKILNRMLNCKNYKQIPEYKKILFMCRKDYFFLMRLVRIYNTNRKIALTALKINVRLYSFLMALRKLKEKNIVREDKIPFD